MVLKSTYNTKLAESIWWNLFLITAGSILFSISIQSIAVPQGFLSGGIMGISMLIWYNTSLLTVPIWYFGLCIPIAIFGWFFVGRVFLLYSVYAIICTTIFGELITFEIPVDNELYAAILAGIINGAGGGMMLRTLGSAGGTDIIAVAIRERWNVSVGKTSFIINAAIFSLGAFTVKLDTIIVSTIMVFISANTLEYVLRLFNQRKMVLIISDHAEIVCEAILLSHQFGATLVRGKGGYSGNDRDIILTVTNNMALKQLEHIVFNVDEHAIFIVENTFYVSGGQFARKIYK